MQHLVSLPLIAYFRFLCVWNFILFQYLSKIHLERHKSILHMHIHIPSCESVMWPKWTGQNLLERSREGKRPIILSLYQRNCYIYLYFYFLEMLKQNDSYQPEFVCSLLDLSHTFPMFLCLDFKTMQQDLLFYAVIWT